MGKIEGLLVVEEAITHLTGASNYTWIHFWNGEKQLVGKNLGHFEKALITFIRIHKTVLVNPAYVTGWQCSLDCKKSGLLTLQAGIELPISRRRWETVVVLMAAWAEK